MNNNDKYTSSLEIGEKYDFKVHQDDRVVCRGATLIWFNPKSKWCQLIWDGQLYDIPSFLVRTKWRKEKVTL